LLTQAANWAGNCDVPVNRVANTTSTVNGSIPSASTHNGFVLNDNSLLFGLRYRF
jgi:hypothetical protein